MNFSKLFSNHSIKSISVTVIFFLLSNAYLTKDLYARDYTQNSRLLTKEAFSDPNYRFPKSQDWIDTPLSYKVWAKNADMAITLDQHLYPALLPIIKSFAKQNNIDIAVKEGTCGISAGLLKQKGVDIAGFCCPPALNDRLPNLQFHTLGIAPLLLLVNPENPINDISLDDIRTIFQGKVKYWSKITSAKPKWPTDLPILLNARLHCKLRPGHWRLILDNEDLFSSNMQDVDSIPDMISIIASNKMAIGYEVEWMTHYYHQQGKTKALHINGFSPFKQKNLITAKYPLYRTFNLTTWENTENNLPKRLIGHLINELPKLDKKYGFIPSEQLKKAGWKFKLNELIGEPNK
jgi:phosphate transport system substrate-binding protein